METGASYSSPEPCFRWKTAQRENKRRRTDRGLEDDVVSLVPFPSRGFGERDAVQRGRIEICD